MEGVEPKTDRELILMIGTNIEAKMDGLTKVVERLAINIEKLETNKIGSIEDRLKILEKQYNELSGIWKFISGFSLILGIVATLVAIFKHG